MYGKRWHYNYDSDVWPRKIKKLEVVTQNEHVFEKIWAIALE